LGEEAGVYHLRQLLGVQKLKVFSAMNDFLLDYRTGNESSPLMHCCFVLLASASRCMCTKPIPVRFPNGFRAGYGGEREWMA